RDCSPREVQSRRRYRAAPASGSSRDRAERAACSPPAPAVQSGPPPCRSSNSHRPPSRSGRPLPERATENSVFSYGLPQTSARRYNAATIGIAQAQLRARQKTHGSSGNHAQVPPDRFELSTSPLPRECSTPELRRQCRSERGGIYRDFLPCQRNCAFPGFLKTDAGQGLQSRPEGHEKRPLGTLARVSIDAPTGRATYPFRHRTFKKLQRTPFIK